MARLAFLRPFFKAAYCRLFQTSPLEPQIKPIV